MTSDSDRLPQEDSSQGETAAASETAASQQQRASKAEPRAVIGFLEAIGEKGLAGWAFRPDDEVPLKLTAWIDDEAVETFVCEISRPDVPQARSDVRELCRHGDALGFALALPERYFDGAEHELRLLTDDAAAVRLMTLTQGRRDSWNFSVPACRVMGQIDLGQSGAPVHGWAVAIDRHTGERRVRNRIRIFTDRDGTIAEVEANAARPDVATVIGSEPYCGFIFRPPEALLAGEPVDVHFSVMPEGIELARSPIPIGGVPAELVAETPMQSEEASRDATSDTRFACTRFAPEALSGANALAEMPTLLSLSDAGEQPVRDYGSAEERLIAAEFDQEYYLASYPDVAAHGVDPQTHFVQIGWAERRRPTAWFDTGYYLEANADVAAAGINPFWHFLAVGRNEGRRPERSGGYRRAILEGLVAPDEKTRGYSRATSVSKLLTTHLQRKFAEAMSSSKGLALSISHDCYVRNTGGVQIFIADEQAGYNRRNITYLHISPLNPDLVLAKPSSVVLFHIVLDGSYLGISALEDLKDVIVGLPSGERFFIVHCLLGHEPEKLAELQAAMPASQNYFWLHDFSSLCEGYNLLRNDIAFCHAPPPSSLACRVCIYGERRPAHQARLEGFFRQIPFTVVAPSRSALQVWREGTDLPHVTSIVHEHCALEENAMRMNLGEGEDDPKRRPARIAFVGYPNVHKGWPVFIELVARTRTLSCYQFFHFTSSEAVPSVTGATRVVAQTSATNRNAMVDALVRHSIDIVLMPAPWPETFSYVAYEALAAGADIITFADSGNIADIVLGRKRGIVVDDSAALFELFESLRIVEYVHLCHQQGMVAGDLIHAGTTATLTVESRESSLA